MYQVSILICDDLVVGKPTCDLESSCVLSDISQLTIVMKA